MNPAAASTVIVGQHVSTIPSRESGLRTVLSGVVTSVDTYQILGSTFVDLGMAAERRTLTMAASSLVSVTP